MGRSHECDFPLSVKRLPACTETKLSQQASSSAIHEDVESLLREALSVYRVDPELLQRLRPTHIVTQTQCEVCAVSLREVQDAVRSLTSSRPVVIALQPGSLSDIWEDVRKVAHGLGVTPAGERLIETMRARMEAIEKKAARLSRRPRVACIEWIDPLMGAGNWMPELVQMAGGIGLFGMAGEHSGWLRWEDILKAQPDILAVLPCGFDLERTRRESIALSRAPGWSDLKAVREGQVYLMDGHQYFNRPGPRLVESLEIFAEIIHPDIFSFGHEGRGWQSM